MVHITELPDLVIHNIIKHVRYSYNVKKVFKKRLPLIAVNRQFRRAGLASLYSCLFLDTKVVDKEYDGMGRPKLIDNGDLYQTSELRSLVRAIKIGKQNRENELWLYLSIITTYLDNLSGPLTAANSLHNYNGLMKNAGRVVERLVKLFPNVTCVVIEIEVAREGEGGEFTSKWIDLLGNQLTSFHSFLPFSQPKTFKVPLELTSLTLNCGLDSKIKLPKFNPLPLKYLNVIAPPPHFSWDCFRQGNGGGPIVFPNLTTLDYMCYTSGDGNRRNNRLRRQAPRTPQLQFPKLITLALTILNSKGGEFKPEVISARLNKLTINADDIAYRGLELSIIKSVGTLDIDTFKLKEDPSNELYNVTNHLLGEVTITKDAVLHLYTEVMVRLDFGRINWSKVTKLKLAGSRQELFLPHLHRMPSLRELSIYARMHSNDDWPVDVRNLPTTPLAELRDHGLKKLLINDEDAIWSTSYVVKLTMHLAKSVRGLKEIELTEDFIEHLEKDMKKASKQHPHLKNIKVSPAADDDEGYDI